MHQAPKFQLVFAAWPDQDRKCWEVAFESDDIFESGNATHLAEATRHMLRSSYGRFLGFLATQKNGLLAYPPALRANPMIVEDYVIWRRQFCRGRGVAIDMEKLYHAFRCICPHIDWSWLSIIARRVDRQTLRKPPRHHLVTSDQLYELGTELMKRAVGNIGEALTLAQALEYRDGLIIALLALIPLRRRSLAALRIGAQLVIEGKLWALEIPGEDTKAGRSLEFPVSTELSQCIDVYLAKVRCRIPGAAAHDSLWASKRRRPMGPESLRRAVRQRTWEAFGFPVSLHRFRHAAATFWSVTDPENVRGVKDLLGHASFTTTETHYVMAQTRIAGRALAQAIDGMRKERGEG
jgi:integrase/recombinase XerD